MNAIDEILNRLNILSKEEKRLLILQTILNKTTIENDFSNVMLKLKIIWIYSYYKK
jgi:hypothetical protein